MSRRHSDEYETEEQILLKRQRWLKAKILDWPAGLKEGLRVKCGLSTADLTALECTTAHSPVLTAAQLDAVEAFVRHATSKADALAAEEEGQRKTFGTVEPAALEPAPLIPPVWNFAPPKIAKPPVATPPGAPPLGARHSDAAQESIMPEEPTPQPEPTAPPTAMNDNTASPRQAQLLERFNELLQTKPAGFKARFTAAVGFSSSTTHAFLKNKWLGNGAVDRIAKALEEDTVWMEDEASSSTSAKRPRQPRETSANPSPKANAAPRRAPSIHEVTIDDLKKAVHDYEAAEQHLLNLTDLFARQRKVA